MKIDMICINLCSPILCIHTHTEACKSFLFSVGWPIRRRMESPDRITLVKHMVYSHGSLCIQINNSKSKIVNSRSAVADSGLWCEVQIHRPDIGHQTIPSRRQSPVSQQQWRLQSQARIPPEVYLIQNMSHFGYFGHSFCLIYKSLQAG